MKFMAELKRRNVVRAGAAYLALAWLVVQLVETLFPMFGISDETARTIVTLVGVGLVPALIFAWAFELTPDGLKRDSEVDHDSSSARRAGRNLDRIVMLLLALGITYFAIDKFILDPARDEAQLETATDVARQEGRVEATVEAFGDKSIAVLPFVNMSSDPEQEYFADGISEEMLNLLARLPELRVISRTSAFKFKGTDDDIPTIARKLNVAHILEGSVRKSGNSIRITAQLIEAGSDRHLWSETYDRKLDDIFSIQDEVAAHVVEQLHVTLLGDVPKAIRVDPAAFELFLQARSIAILVNRERYPVVLELLEQALAIEPDYLEAMLLTGMVTEDPAARERVSARVLELDPDNATLKAWSAVNEPDLATAASLVSEAAATDPLNQWVLFNGARIAKSIGSLELAIEIYEYVVARDPLMFWAHLNLADYYLHAQRIEEALEQYRASMAINPSEGAVQWKYGLALLVAGQPEAALAAFENEPDRVPYGFHGLALAYHDLGQLDESALLLAELVENEALVWPFGLARAYAWIGDADEAFRYLEASAEVNRHLLGGLGRHPLFRQLHDDPRWMPFLESIGQAPEQLGRIELNIDIPN